ncbi:DotH/IcmK family type IV secretion protein [Cupriavidus sp. TMH.W2]|uniref:DotH/IcmK family type IV secretion protein n=1 Tax=Cupriavidus sp. TMH.W2 TaxID=3434465 RepID=UPI003D772E24
MRKLLTALALTTTAAAAPAQQQVPLTTPPVPIVREQVDSIVKGQAALVLTPEQIEQLKLGTAQARKQMVSPYPQNKVAKPVARPFYIDPTDSDAPRLVRLESGWITSLVFSDTNGNPWFVKSVSLDCSQFTDGVSCPGDAGGAGAGGKEKSSTNIVKLQPKFMYGYGNVVVELEDLASPITFVLTVGQSNEVDSQISARISGRNPNARPQIMAMDRLPEADGAMGAFLDGVPPPGAVRLKVGGTGADAWTLNGKLYLRTRHTLLSPAFMNHVGSADGMHVYAFNRVYPSLLVSINGKGSSLTISGN